MSGGGITILRAPGRLGVEIDGFVVGGGMKLQRAKSRDSYTFYEEKNNR